MATHPEPSSHDSPNKRVKTLTDCCGICLSEACNGGVSRGYIDSCNHYFCFVCIMEWAKVESKCPLCKRRFSTIRRPPKPPIFTSERVVQVPVRDQVYHYFGNATTGPPDPYSEAKCSMCHGIADESLLLLCDLCDAASHTYCVGLGATVPEGDWFCQDCTLLRDEHLKSETDIDCGIQISSDTDRKLSSANEHVSVFDIVREPCGEFQRSRSASSGPCYVPPTSSAADETSMIKIIDRPSSSSLEIVTEHQTKPNARTLRHCRNLHGRIRVLRENWSGFRNGILHFSSPRDGNISSQKSVTCKSGRNSVSCLNQQSKLQCSSSDITNDDGEDDIHKAWRMMDKAMSVKQGHERSITTILQASEFPTRKLDATKNAEYMSYRHLSPDSQQNGLKNPGSMGQESHYNHFPEKEYYKQAYAVSGKQKWRRHITEDVTNFFEGSITGPSTTSYRLKSSKAVPTLSYLDDASVRNEKLPTEKSFKGPACLSSSLVSEPVVLNVDHGKLLNHTSSPHTKVKHPKEKSELEKICVDRQRYNDAKSEIQSLVKLNLKLQMKEEKLGVDAFKEVARLATHSILAACGLEHPKPGSCSIPGFICSHTDEVRLLQKSSLMPNSCRECFYVFVKDMVNTAMLKKTKT